MKITKLDDIKIYRDALNFARKVYTLSKNPVICKEYSLIDQIKRAAISVAANIAEGYGRNTREDFSQFLSISLGSVNEVITYLDFITLVFSVDASALKEHYLILSKRIHSFRSYLQKSSYPTTPHS